MTLDALTHTMLATNALTATNRTALPEQRRASAVKSINQSALFGYDRELTLARDPSTKQDVVKIISRSTGETIAQMPDEIVLQLHAFLQQHSV